jgi:hypothetical protein
MLMRRWLVNIVILLASISLVTNAVAQDADQPKMRAKVIVDSESGVSVTRPEGWVNGKKKSGGAVAVFRAAGESEAQIDVLVSKLKRDSAASAYFTSFHANLQKAGLVKKDVRKDASYGDKKGIETEYDAASKSRNFRLIVWQYHRNGVAVLVTGFFPTDQRDKHYTGFQEVIEGLELK